MKDRFRGQSVLGDPDSPEMVGEGVGYVSLRENGSERYCQATIPWIASAASRTARVKTAVPVPPARAYASANPATESFALAAASHSSS